ncbi:pyrimidine 5'-nucleotidase [Kiloniella laminariae]|uniref:Pyrimidine 5'-nucleotidase n=1 Tax=Kiloniella laminariae TaxID=454162 RepID=A0ABT4LMK2_9PROT|nr:pyrimidine 5'-nucleotidase [Kiloniella laminariae]MCZ4281596.1 pyrimidine 5'-nucleotidase [Kiloniella laminariae]
MALLGGKDVWLFDLDNTLYPASSRLFDQIEQRMGSFIEQYLGLDPVAAKTVQKDYFKRYGTTLKGLMVNHGLAPNEYLDYVHDIDFSVIRQNQDLSNALERLPGRKLIFTNASNIHATNVMNQLGVLHLFEEIYDIADADYIPKPAQFPYDDLIKKHGIDPKQSVFFEDSAKNLEPAAAMGMTTVWVRTDTEWAAHGATSENGERSSFIHHETDDLITWLNNL